MPLIAIVGEEGNLNEPSAMMQDYLRKLHDVQELNDGALNRYLTAPTIAGGKGYSAEDAVLPIWEFKYFSSKDEMFDYTQEKDYTYQDGRPGICFGF